jgi:hypothetical protein
MELPTLGFQAGCDKIQASLTSTLRLSVPVARCSSIEISETSF